MDPTDAPISPTRRPLVLIVLGTALLAALATLGVLYAAGLLTPTLPTRQAMVHTMGSQVMPFDLDRTTHVFEMTDTGGVQRVLVKDPSDATQIALVQQHLQHEAMQFRAGDFDDPASIHGTDMPGLHALAAGAAKISVEYTALPNGAQIAYTTQDPQLITALHQWFGAQLADHGHDAMSHDP
jgi:hypothetical protein